MNFLKRAILAVTRRRSKSLIMFVIFVTIANLVMAGFAIQHATEYASVLARQKLGGQLTLRFNNQRAMEEARNQGQRIPRVQSEPITEEMGNLIASHQNIIDYNYIVNASGMAEGFEPVTSEEPEEGQSQQGVGGRMGQLGMLQGMGIVIPDVTVIGITSSRLTDAFNNGNAIMLQGRDITMEDGGSKVGIIEKNLALQNGFNIGDNVRIKSIETEDILDFAIVGIYESIASEENQGFRMRGMAFSEPYNRIYVDYKSAMDLKYAPLGIEIMSRGIDSAVFFVDDPKNISTVLADAASMDIDWEKFVLDANDSAYRQMMGPIENVASFSMTVVYVVAIAGAMILALLLMLSVKERMFETGVLLSMGEGKIKIIGQYVAEVMIIAFLAFAVSSFSGSFIAQGVGNSLLDREVKLVQEQQQTTSAFGRGGVPNAGQGGGQFRSLLESRFQMGSGGNVEPIDSFDISITLDQILKMTLIGILIIIGGTILPAATIMRYKPRTILTKTS